ncbi:4'-phosphopantetheinyl transferase family protein [Streptomyces sp. NPDC059009]|uniref:4'-phosphopantetheinyl transferase family protein n=1 Tax=Streptomyces sp. NPDC059009 TaxID=3346694 RepID=UPI00367DF518
MDTISRDPQLLGEYHPFGHPVKVWAAQAPLPHAASFTAYAAELASDERAQLARIATGAARARFMTGRALARRVLARELRTPASHIRFAATETGRPFVTEPPCPGLDFNLSHSGRLTLLAVTWRGRVGIDVEQTTVERDFAGVAAGFFSPAEYEQWSTADTADRTVLWYRTWTRREAYVKATGFGLRDIGDDHHGRGSAWIDIPLAPAPGHVGCVVLLNRH